MGTKTTALNTACPALYNVAIGDKLNAIIDLINDLKAKYDAAVTLINELKTDLNNHTHTVTHAACAATGAIYGTATNITSSTGPAITSTDAATTAKPAVPSLE